MNFRIDNHTGDGKAVNCVGPGDLRFTVDTDDVWVPEIEAFIEWMLHKLNDAYAADPPTLPKWEDQLCDCGFRTNGDCADAGYLECQS